MLVIFPTKSKLTGKINVTATLLVNLIFPGRITAVAILLIEIFATEDIYPMIYISS